MDPGIGKKATTMKICCIVHGGEQIGMGHVTRTLALALAFQNMGYEVMFISKYFQGIERLKSMNFLVQSISSSNTMSGRFSYGDKTELRADEKEIERILNRNYQDFICVDSYNVDIYHFEFLARFAKRLIYIDDINAFPYPVDVLLNGTASAADMGYCKVKEEELMLLGVSYNLTNPQYWNLPPRYVDREVKNLLITTGFSDPFYMSLKLYDIVKKWKGFPHVNIHIISGGGYEKNLKRSIRFLVHEGVCVYESPQSLVNILQTCDIAITSGGSTIYELAACGVPSLVFIYADNQLPQVKALERMGLIINLGNYDKISPVRLLDALEQISGDWEKRKKLVIKLQHEIDGNGSKRAAERINEYWK